MAEESKKSNLEPPCAEEVMVVSDVLVAEKVEAPVLKEKVPEAEKVGELTAEVVVEGVKDGATEEVIVDGPAAFKEESNKVDELVDPEKKALAEFKLLIKEALKNREFTLPPPLPPLPTSMVEKGAKKELEPKAEAKEEEESNPVEKVEDSKAEEKTDSAEVPPPSPPVVEAAKLETEAAVEKKAEKETIPPPNVEAKTEASSETVAAKEDEKFEPVVEEIKETIIHEVTVPVPFPCEDDTAAATAESEKAVEKPAKEAKKESPQPPEEVFIWGIPLLADERSDAILLKFLRARDFKVKDAFSMLKSVVAWRKDFKIDELLEEEDIIEGLDKVIFIRGVDKEGHPVCYNAFGEFQDKDLYSKTFADSEKRAKFLKWYIQFLEKNIRKLNFSPDGTCTIVQITDLKNSPGLILFKKELRQATNQALQLLQDNYPEFVAKQVFINVPWWYVAYNRMISPFLTQRTKSKFVFAGPSRTAETLFTYIAPEQVPVQYGGLSKDREQDFTTADSATVEIIKPSCRHAIELPITKACTLVWEVRVVGWDVAYGAEFVPNTEATYTWIIQKSRKIGASDEQVISCTFKIGEPGKVVLTFDNQTSKKRKLLYRSKINPSD